MVSVSLSLSRARALVCVCVCVCVFWGRALTLLWLAMACGFDLDLPLGKTVVVRYVNYAQTAMTVHVRTKSTDGTITNGLGGGNSTLWTLEPTAGVQDGANPPGQPSLISPQQSSCCSDGTMEVPAFSYAILVSQLP